MVLGQWRLFQEKDSTKETKYADPFFYKLYEIGDILNNVI